MKGALGESPGGYVKEITVGNQIEATYQWFHEVWSPAHSHNVDCVVGVEEGTLVQALCTLDAKAHAVPVVVQILPKNTYIQDVVKEDAAYSAFVHIIASPLGAAQAHHSYAETDPCKINTVYPIGSVDERRVMAFDCGALEAANDSGFFGKLLRELKMIEASVRPAVMLYGAELSYYEEALIQAKKDGTVVINGGEGVSNVCRKDLERAQIHGLDGVITCVTDVIQKEVDISRISLPFAGKGWGKGAGAFVPYLLAACERFPETCLGHANVSAHEGRSSALTLCAKL